MSALLVAAVAAVLGSAVTVWWLRARVVVVRVEGGSMEPALHTDDRVVVRRHRPDRLRSGQIVVLERPDLQDRWVWSGTRLSVRRHRWIVKRLVAMPGDPVAASIVRYGSVSPGPVPPGFCLVLGDNADASTDSREFGPVPLDRVLGVAVRRFGHGGESIRPAVGSGPAGPPHGSLSERLSAGSRPRPRRRP